MEVKEIAENILRVVFFFFFFESFDLLIIISLGWTLRQIGQVIE